MCEPSLKKRKCLHLLQERSYLHPLPTSSPSPSHARLFPSTTSLIATLQNIQLSSRSPPALLRLHGARQHSPEPQSGRSGWPTAAATKQPLPPPAAGPAVSQSAAHRSRPRGCRYQSVTGSCGRWPGVRRRSSDGHVLDAALCEHACDHA
jgi:hypothetical protein